MDSLPVLLAGVPTALEVKLREALPDVSWKALPGAGRLGDALEGAAGSTAVVVLDGDLEPGFRLIRELDRSGVRVVVVGPTKDADVILRAMREGAKEFVVAGDDEGLARSVRERVRSRSGAGAGSVYSVLAAKGGVGATTLAVNLAGALQRRGRRTCLVDLDLNMGDVLAFLDLAGGYSISDVIANMRRLDRDLLEATLPRHGSGVHVLSQSHRVEDSDAVSPAMLTALLHYLRQHYAAVVVDGLRSFDDGTLAALEASDQILLVLTPEVPAVRDARRSAALLRRLGAAAKLRLVLNRFQKQLEITPEVVAETVGVPVAATIANDYPTVIRSVNRGVLLVDEAGKAPVTRDIEALVEALEPAAEVEAPRPRRSLLRRLFAG